MTTVKHVRKPQDEGSRETFRTLDDLKKNAPDFQQLVKLAKAHQQATLQYVETGKQLVDHLLRISTRMNTRNSDLSEALLGISAMEKTVLLNFDEVGKTIDNELCNKLTAQLNKEHKETALFERDYKQKHNHILQQISKAEKESQKAGKKSAFQLQAAIQTITDKMNEMKEHRQSKLKQIFLIERKKYCDFLNMWTNVVESQVQLFEQSQRSLSEQLPKWKEIQLRLHLTNEAESLVEEMGLRERTSTAIDGSLASSSDYGESEYGGEENYDSYGGSYGGEYEEEGEYYEESGESYAAQARALYDYVGTHDYELSFKAGDIINVTNQDNESGWWTGELHGQVGPFPGNYVELI